MIKYLTYLKKILYTIISLIPVLILPHLVIYDIPLVYYLIPLSILYYFLYSTNNIPFIIKKYYLLEYNIIFIKSSILFTYSLYLHIIYMKENLEPLLHIFFIVILLLFFISYYVIIEYESQSKSKSHYKSSYLDYNKFLSFKQFKRKYYD